MAIISIFSGTYCHSAEIIDGVAEKCERKWTDSGIIEATAKRWSISAEKLHRAVFGPAPFLGNFRRERTKYAAYLKMMLAEVVKEENILLDGFIGHFISTDIPHIVQVCVIANYDYRMEIAMKSLSEKEAKQKIKKDDEIRTQWTQYLFEKAPYNDSLYDIIIPMQTTSIEDAIEIILNNSQKEAVKTTSESLKKLEDFSIAAIANHTLLNKGYDDFDISCEDGIVTVAVNKSVTRLEHYMGKIKSVVEELAEVKSAEVKVGTKYQQPSILTTVEFQLPKKVLLVDDEKEFVHTLSERLQTRNLESTIVYDGEEALARIKDEEPEVMVLDLKMPGIDGIEVLRRVKKEHPDIEVIILTGHGSEKEEALAHQLGAFAYLQKPVNIDVLAQKMKDAYRKIAEKKSAD